MNSKASKVINEIVAVLIREYQPEKIILFGSHAYGKPDKESDIDLLVVKETSLSFYKRLAEVRRIVCPVRRGYPFEPIVLTPKEIKERMEKRDPFLEEVINEGKAMYA